MARILVVGLNPAWQKILKFEGIRPGEVNRAQTLVQLASGKGMNAAKVLRRLGHEVHLLQVLGGANGQRCLVACQALGIRSRHAWVEEETRQCLTLVDCAAGNSTEIIEPFEVETPGSGEAVMATLSEEPSTFDATLLIGTIPTGLPSDLFSRILETVHPGVTLLDAWKDVDAALLSKVDLVKVNRAEYASLERLIGGERPLVLVTAGDGEAAVSRGRKPVARIPMARLENVVNPIGAGDAVSAGTLHFVLEGLDPVEAFRRALAMGSASCLDLEPAQFAWDRFEALLPRVGPPVYVN